MLKKFLLRKKNPTTNGFIVAVFDKEENLSASARGIRGAGIDIYDIYTPYPIHALERVMGIQRSRLPYVCFGAALGGCLLALAFQVWTSAVDWPLNVGGKPFNSFPAFIPIAFEITVLLGGLITTAAFLARSELFPAKNVLPLKDLMKSPKLLHGRITDDHFAMVIEKTRALDLSKVRQIFKSGGAVVVEERGGMS